MSTTRPAAVYQMTNWAILWPIEAKNAGGDTINCANANVKESLHDDGVLKRTFPWNIIVTVLNTVLQQPAEKEHFSCPCDRLHRSKFMEYVIHGHQQDNLQLLYKMAHDKRQIRHIVTIQKTVRMETSILKSFSYKPDQRFDLTKCNSLARRNVNRWHEGKKTITSANQSPLLSIASRLSFFPVNSRKKSAVSSNCSVQSVNLLWSELNHAIYAM